MLIETAITVSVLSNWIKIVSGIMSCVGLFYGVFKVINWLKSTLIRLDTNVLELKKSMDDHIGGLREDIKVQTATLAAALQEQRADFRTFCAPSLSMMNQQFHPLLAATPVRAKRAAKKS
jgi:hypothetical protein